MAHVYRDSRGLWTIARGCLVDRSIASEGLCQAAQDVQNAHSIAVAAALAAKIPGFEHCNEVRQAVLTSMCYQMGDLEHWPGFKAALATLDYTTAADQMLNSAWHGQTRKRCERAAEMMRSGNWLNKT